MASYLNLFELHNLQLFRDGEWSSLLLPSLFFRDDNSTLACWYNLNSLEFWLGSSLWDEMRYWDCDCGGVVAEPPKRLGPGALISIARQLGPNLACIGSSSSEASIKATLFQNRAGNTHTKVSPEITTQNISYISEWLQRKINLLQTKFRVVKYYKVQLLKLFKSYCSAEAVKDN